MDQLPGSFVWRGIELARVVHTERTGGGMFDYSPARVIERPSNPPVFSGTVGCWRYTLERQADGTWVGKIYLGSACNIISEPYADFVAALDFAAEWWKAVVFSIPEAQV